MSNPHKPWARIDSRLQRQLGHYAYYGMPADTPRTAIHTLIRSLFRKTSTQTAERSSSMERTTGKGRSYRRQRTRRRSLFRKTSTQTAERSSSMERTTGKGRSYRLSNGMPSIWTTSKKGLKLIPIRKYRRKTI